MNELPDRLRLAREHLGLSQKEMAQTIGSSFRALQDYESGKNTPGGKVFEAYCKLGFHGTWLLTGEGQMTIPESGADRAGGRRPRPKPYASPVRRGRPPGNGGELGVSADMDDPALKVLLEEAPQLQALGLDGLLLIARRGNQGGLWRVLTTLSRHPEGCSLEGLRQLLERRGEPVTSAELTADVTILTRQGLVRELPGDREHRLVLTRNITGLKAQDVANISVHAREAVRAILRRIVPALEPQDGRGRMLTAVARVPLGQGRPMVQALFEAVREICERQGAEDGPEEVTVVLGAGLEVEELS